MGAAKACRFCIAAFFVLFSCSNNVAVDGMSMDFLREIFTTLSSYALSGQNQKEDNRPGMCPIITKLSPEDYLRHSPDESTPEDLEQGRILSGSGDSKKSARDIPENLRDSLCGNMCTSDGQCGANKKCCPTTCGYACYNAVFLAD